MSKKAVLISCFHYYDYRVRPVKEYLQSRGFDCTYFTADFDHVAKTRFEVNLPDCVQIPTLPYQKNLSAARLRSHMRFSRDVFSRLEELDPDLIYAIVPPNSLCRRAAEYRKKHPKVRLIFDLYDLWPETFPNGRAKKLLALPFSVWRRQRDGGLHAADFVVTECELYRQVLKKQLEGIPTGVLPLCRPAVTAAEKFAAPDTEELGLCYLGSINNIIDIPLIARLLRGIASARPVCLHVIGDGESREELLRAAKDAGARTAFYGKVFDAEQKQQIFDCCSFGINVMKGSVCVGLTMKSLDYFAGGLPILNTIGGDTQELLEQRGIGFNVCRENPAETAKRAAKITVEENRKMREETLRVFRERFSEEAFCAQLDRLLGKIAEGGK